MQNPLKKIVTLQKQGQAVGIYSCCSANKFVIKAALLKGKMDNSPVLIESTANQCDQYGGYTGMTPIMFRQFVEKLADEIGFDKKNLFLGGDHLGPLTFAHLNESEAMQKAEELIEAYVSAGFTKIHLDTSMRLNDDDLNQRLSDLTIASRGARLARIAKNTFKKLQQVNKDAIEPVYIVGSEVPIPGGQTGCDTGVCVTDPKDFIETYNTFQQEFLKNDLEDVWQNVIGIVVQPGVEEKDAGCTEYDREKAKDLMQAIKKFDNIVFEGHSTDYQTKYKLRQLVEDEVAILKVGPGLTFAAREALYALAYCEKEAFKENRSNLIEIIDQKMLENPKYWSKHYVGNQDEIALKRKFSFSDRSRYYMPDKDVSNAIDKLLKNFENGVPLNLLSQFMPIQYTKVRCGEIENKPESLIIDRVINTIDEYLFATNQSKLLD